MKLETNKSRISLIKKRDGYKCCSCYRKLRTKEIDVYELEYEKSKSKFKKHAIVCKKCKEVLDKLGVMDEDINGYVSLLENKRFIDHMLATPIGQKPWLKSGRGSGGTAYAKKTSNRGQSK